MILIIDGVRSRAEASTFGRLIWHDPLATWREENTEALSDLMPHEGEKARDL